MLESTQSPYPGRTHQEYLGIKSPGSPSWVWNHKYHDYYCQRLGSDFNAFFLHTIIFPDSGGDQKSHVVSGASNSFTIDQLRESSSYKLQVSAMVGRREGSPVLVTARTRESCLKWPTVQRKICIVWLLSMSKEDYIQIL